MICRARRCFLFTAVGWRSDAEVRWCSDAEVRWCSACCWNWLFTLFGYVFKQRCLLVSAFFSCPTQVRSLSVWIEAGVEFAARIDPTRAAFCCWIPSFLACSAPRDARLARSLCAARSLGSCTSRFYHPSRQSTCKSSRAARGWVQVFFLIAAPWYLNGATWTHHVLVAHWPSTCPWVGSAR